MYPCGRITSNFNILVQNYVYIISYNVVTGPTSLYLCFCHFSFLQNCAATTALVACNTFNNIEQLPKLLNDAFLTKLSFSKNCLSHIIVFSNMRDSLHSQNYLQFTLLV